MNLFRVFADNDGETHLERIDVTRFARPEDGQPARVGLKEIPATTLTITELLERKPDLGLHPAPRRQLVIVLRGALEVTTTAGDVERFGAGDCLLTDDVTGNGHLTREVGDEPLASVIVGVSADWACPTA